MKDYLSLIALAGTLGDNGKTLLRAIMTPPLLWKDGAYGMNQSVLNDVRFLHYKSRFLAYFTLKITISCVFKH